MAYDGAALSFVSGLLGQLDGIWIYRNTDTFIGTVDASGHFTDGYDRGMRTGQAVIYHKTNGTQPTLAYVSVANATTKACTVAALGSGASAGAGTFTTLTASGATTLNGAVTIGDAAADVVGFYGGTGSSQRAAAAQATTAVAVSASFGATQLAALQEVMNVLIAASLMKGAA